MKIPEGFTKICQIKDLKENSGKRFFIGDIDTAVFKLNNEIFALSNICPHQHAALLFDGFIEDEFIACPAHGWQFSLRTGKTPEGRNGISIYETFIEDGWLYIKAHKKELAW